VEILCTQYGKLAGLWFDGNWSRPERDWQEDALYGLIRRHQPEAIIVNNSSVNARGRRGHPEVDVLTFEQGAPVAAGLEPGEKYLAREMCETMTSHWGSAEEGDFSQKSPAQVIATLAQCRRHGANLLLNVGPEASGRLPAYERAALEVVGAWIRRQPGDALYRAAPDGALCCRGKDFVLRDGKRLLYFAHDLGIAENVHLGGELGGLRTVQGAVGRVRRVRWRDTGEELRFSQDLEAQMLTLALTPNPYGAQAVVRVAELET
jgi:alpha-L-fucosidase